MRNGIPISALCLVLCFQLLVPPSRTQACGPFFPTAIYAFAKHPDFPLEEFARGDLGVLGPDYAWSYLVVAYRHFTGVGMTAGEQQAALKVWNKRLRIGKDAYEEAEESVQRWIETRNKVPEISKIESIELYRGEQAGYSSYLNYNSDAFDSAVKTLDAMVRKFGAENRVVRDWVAAQDLVFSNGGAEKRLPEPLPASTDAELRSERAYQIAAANFYAADFDQAAKLFETIARDSGSPRSRTAKYLTLRSLYRKASVAVLDEAERRKVIEKALQTAQGLLKDPKQAEFHASIQGFANRLKYLSAEAKLAGLQDEERQAKAPEAYEPVILELARDVLTKNSDDFFFSSLWDYTAKLSRVVPDEEYTVIEQRQVNRKMSDYPAFRTKDDLTDWILVFQADDAPALDYALRKWETSKSLPWLVACLSKADGKTPQARALLDAASQVPATSPGQATVLYHRIRLMNLLGKFDDARRLSDAALSAKGKTLRPSVKNLLFAQRMASARTLGEALDFVIRKPAVVTDDYDYREIPFESATQESLEDVDLTLKELKAQAELASLDLDGARMLNQGLPLTMLTEAVMNQGMPLHLRRRLAAAAWVRAGLVGNHAAATGLAPIVGKLAPELKEHTDAYVAAKTDEARTFAVVFAALRFPGLRPYVDAGVPRTTPLNKIDEYRDNWWCAFTLPRELTASNFEKYGLIQYGDSDSASEPDTDPNKPKPLKSVAPENAFFPPAFLSDDQRAAALKEWRDLCLVETAPNYLSRAVLSWASKNPSDPRVPEALHLAVRTTRFGCTDEETSKLSKQAFQLLQRKYPTTEWARKTKFHY